MVNKLWTKINRQKGQILNWLEILAFATICILVMGVALAIGEFLC